MVEYRSSERDGGIGYSECALDPYPKGPFAPKAHTLGPMYRYREYFEAKVYTIWVKEF